MKPMKKKTLMVKKLMKSFTKKNFKKARQTEFTVE